MREVHHFREEGRLQRQLKGLHGGGIGVEQAAQRAVLLAGVNLRHIAGNGGHGVLLDFGALDQRAAVELAVLRDLIRQKGRVEPDHGAVHTGDALRVLCQQIGSQSQLGQATEQVAGQDPQLVVCEVGDGTERLFGFLRQVTVPLAWKNSSLPKAAMQSAETVTSPST